MERIKKNVIISIIIILSISLLTLFLLKNINKENNLFISKKSNEIKAEYEYEGYVTVKFSDEKMAKAVYGALEGSAFPKDYQYLSGTELPILETVLTNTTKLTLYNSKASEKITNIEGIEKFSNLTNLKLANNLITDISPIQYLTKLNSLDLSLNENISDISCLQNNTELQILNLAGNKIKNLEGISKLYKLKELNIAKNQITSSEIENIIGLGNLTILNAETNQIDDIKPILNLVALKDLNLYGNRVQSLENISDLRKLEKLNLGNNGLGTSQVKYIFKGVKILYSEDEQGDRTIVGEYNNDNRVWIYNEKYNEAEKSKYKTTTIAMLDHLYYLNVELNNMTDLFTDSNIQYMTNLKEIYAQSNHIANLTNIYKLVNLEILNLNDNIIKNDSNVKNLEPLFKTYKDDNDEYQLYLQKFTNISLAENQIEFIYSDQMQGDFKVRYSFANFKNLRSLNLSRNRIYQISTIAYKEFDSIQLFEQKINLTVMKREAGDDFQEVILPDIYMYTLKEGSNVYSDEEFSYVNCSKTSEDGKITEHELAFVDTYDLTTNQKEATIKINGGYADGTILTINSTTTTTTSNALETIAFTDKNLYNAVKSTLIKYTIDNKIDNSLWGYHDKHNLINIYYESKGLQAFKDLDASNYNIESVDGIKRLITLTNLDISNNKITNVSEIALLPNITTLNISANKIENLSKFNYVLGVANRKNKENKTTSELAWCKRIKILTAYTNNIDNIESINTCTPLTNLNLLENKITDITPLTKLTNLTELNLTDNYIDEIESIASLTKLDDLRLGNNHGEIEDKDLVHLSNLPVLKSLDLSNNYLKDISSLNSITSLRILNLNNNLIENINLIKELTRLGNLDLSQNKISDLTGINKFTQLTTLILKKNKISDVTNLRSLTSLVTLDLSYNKVEDISTIEILDKTYNLDVITLNDQTITIELTEEQTKGTEEIELPKLFKKALIENNLVYTTKELSTNNCTVDTDRKIITVSDLGSKIAWVKIKDGIAQDSQVVISEPLKGTIKYSTKEPTKDSVDATVSFNRTSVTVTNNDGKNTYTFTENGEFTFEFEDDYGFTGTAMAKVDWIDKEAPTATITSDKTEITKEDVTVTVTANEECKPVEGWTLSEDKKILTKIYSDNTNEKITLEDKLGNQRIIDLIITNIDKTAPEITGVVEGQTYNHVVTPVITDENLKLVELKKDGKIVENYTSETPITENGEYILTAKDRADNTTIVNFIINIKYDEKILSSIAITSEPSKKDYVAGENFDPAGMVVTATYNDGSKKVVTNYTVTDGDNLEVGKTNVTISYTENGVTKPATQAIEVKAAERKKLTSIEVTTPPSKTVWFEQDVINYQSYYGMIVTAIYNDGTSREVTDYEIVNGTNLAVGTTNVIIKYTEDGVTRTATQPMTVLAETGGENILKEDSEYKIVGASMIAGVKPKTTIKEFKNEINDRYQIAELYEVKDNVMYKVEDENEYVKTDMLIEIREINGFTGFRGALVVTGDCNGSGTANVSDITKLMISRAESLAQNKDESKILKGAYEKAVDLNGDGKINSVDITRLLMYIAENK